MSIEDKQARLDELRDLQTDHELALDAIHSEIEDLEYEIEEANEQAWLGWNEDRRSDDHDRAADMNATLRDIGSWT
jgi:chromosome segregation ATPase